MRDFNIKALLYSPVVFLFEKQLAIPHFFVNSINDIDPVKLKIYGCNGVIFDKDGTLTVPYEIELAAEIHQTAERFKDVFGGRAVIMSNSAGFKGDDPSFKYAEEVEQSTGFHVIRHDSKKPFGLESVKKYFGNDITKLAVVGDSILIDIVFGNRNGMLTICNNPLSFRNRRKMAERISKLERSLVKKWMDAGIKAPNNEIHYPDICISR